MTIVYSPAQDGSGAVVAPDGRSVGFSAGVTPKDLFALQAALLGAAPAVTVNIDMSGLAALQQQVDGLQTSVGAMQAAVAAKPAA